MNYSNLEKNLTDMVMEQQAKLGYMSETVRLYYPLSSLNAILGENLTREEMQDALDGFSENVRERLGKIQVSHSGDRFCLVLPPEMSDHVHSLTELPGNEDFHFILDFVKTISRHECTIEELKDLFDSYSDKVCMESPHGNDYDYMLWFEDGKPDSYRYLITDEGVHLTYHRYTPEDYKDIFKE